MRITVIFVIVSLVTMDFTNAQSPGNKKIILTCKDSSNDLYKRIGSYLAGSGYSIENSNSDFLTIKTAPKRTSKWNFVYALNIVVVNHLVKITTQWKINSPVDPSFHEWEFTNAKMGNAPGIIYNDILTSLTEFDREGTEYN